MSDYVYTGKYRVWKGRVITRGAVYEGNENDIPLLLVEGVIEPAKKNSDKKVEVRSSD